MKWLAEAPSNIALIKYMGRKSEENKIPANPSLSYTLPHLKSFVELELLPESNHISRWEPLVRNDTQPITLSESGQQRFLSHLDRVLRVFFKDSALPRFIVRSANNFPLGVGLASSASSFAALTLAAAQAGSALTHEAELSLDRIMSLSRQGSGSSCRSFYDSWVYWDDETVKKVDCPTYADLIHQVILLETQEKEIPSSQAHQRVKTSPFYEGRVERATERLSVFMEALKNKNWQRMYELAWDEFHDMHNLFETAIPPFTYHNDASLALLNKLKDYWNRKNDGPLITMDAGPNIHLLYRIDQKDIQHEIQHQLLSGYAYVLSA